MLSSLVSQMVTAPKVKAKVVDDKRKFQCPACPDGVKEYVGDSTRLYSYCKACISKRNKRRYLK